MATYVYRFLPQRGFDYVSEDIVDIVGYSAEEHYADPHLGLKIAFPPDLPRLQAYIQSGGADNPPLLLRWQARDGTVVLTQHDITPIHDGAGRVVAIRGVVHKVPRPRFTGRRRSDHDHER